jgi:3-deoxy-manno-octulosonate cytidylyltransferase (CMP-KDO synthetase)
MDGTVMQKILGLIPTRLNSSRLPQKALLKIENIPLVVHTYKRSKLSKKLDEVYICCDHEKIFNVVKKFGVKCIMTSPHHLNGTERIYEAYKKISKNKRFDLIVDIQGDEPLVSPYHIDSVVTHHLKNFNYDIVLPTISSDQKNNTNIIKVISNIKNEVMYLSRSNIPFEYKITRKFINKHLSIISFKPDSLKKFSENNKTPLEKIEDIELLRALEIGLKIKTFKLKGDSFSVDVLRDFKNAKKSMKLDKFFKFYKNQ